MSIGVWDGGFVFSSLQLPTNYTRTSASGEDVAGRAVTPHYVPDVTARPMLVNYGANGYRTRAAAPQRRHGPKEKQQTVAGLWEGRDRVPTGRAWVCRACLGYSL